MAGKLYIHRFGKLIALIAFVGCADNAYDPDAPAIDPNAPRVHITSPARGTVAGDVQTVTVTGTATDDSGVESVTVNGVTAQLAVDGSFTAQVPVVPGTNLLHAIAKDEQGNQGKESRAVVAGPQATLARQVPDAITATLSALNQSTDNGFRNRGTEDRVGSFSTDQESLDDQVNMYGLVLDWKLDSGTILSSTNYFDRELVSIQDQIGLLWLTNQIAYPLSVVVGPQFGQPPCTFQGLRARYDLTVREFNQELRYVSDFKGPFELPRGAGTRAGGATGGRSARRCR